MCVPSSIYQDRFIGYPSLSIITNNNLDLNVVIPNSEENGLFLLLNVDAKQQIIVYADKLLV
jgi:hypothetical protein